LSGIISGKDTELFCICFEKGKLKSATMSAHSLYEGSYSVDTSKTFKPFDPEIHDRKDRPGSLFIHVHPFVIETPSGLILLDTGLGFPGKEEGLLLHENIRKKGLDPADVRYVLLSHLHKDHAGGTVMEKDGALKLSFPDAEYVIQQGEWEEAFSGNSESYKTEFFEVLQRSGNLLLVEGEGMLTNEIHYGLSGGHTEHHQVFHIYTGGEHYFYGGDEAPEPEQFFRSFAAKYDYDGRKAMKLREEYWEQGSREGWVFLMYHSTNIAMGRPEKKPSGDFKLVEAF